jgi:hypothetical protein
MTTLAMQNWLYENSHEGSYLLRREFVPETSYALKDAGTVPTSVDAITARVVSRVGTLSRPRMNAELSEILSQFRITASDPDLKIDHAAPLEIVDADDGSVLIEWHFKDRRLGFNIEPEEGQSGWYYAFSRESGGQCGSGTLTSLDMKILLHLILGQDPHR